MSSSQKRMHQGPNPSSKKTKMGRSDRGEDPGAALRREHLELERLVIAMEQEDRPQLASSHTLAMRRERALALWGGVGPHLRGQPHARLEARIQRVCQRALEVIAEMDKDATEDPLRMIFFGSSQQADKSAAIIVPGTVSPAKGAQTDAGQNKRREKKASAQKTSIAPPQNIQDLQKTQREQMESAISQMAAQMKEETSKIHSTLQQQTTGVLAEMEDVAVENVEQVSKVAKDVKDHVRKGWKRSIGTWTMLFTISGAFLLCLLVIQMAPKRPDACLFLCRSERKDSGFTGRRASKAMENKKICDSGMNNGGSCTLDETSVDIDHVETLVAAAVEAPTRNDKRMAEEEAMEDLGNIEFPEAGSVEEIIEEYMETVQSIGDIPTVGGAAVRYDLDDIHFPLDGEVDDALREYMETVEAVHGAPRNADPENTRDRDDDGDSLQEEEPQSDFFAAVLSGDVELVKRFMADRPELILLSDDKSRTVLHVAVLSKSDAMVELLMALGADQTSMTADGETLLDVSVEVNGKEHPISCRLKGQVHDGMPFTTTDLRAAAELNQLERVRGYLSAKSELVNEGDENGWAPLHLATRAGNTEVVRLLMDIGADISLVTAANKSPLNIALERLGSNHPISRMLQGHNSPIDVARDGKSIEIDGGTDDQRRNSEVGRDAYDSTISIALLAAAAHGDLKTLKSLLEYHRDLKDATDENNWNALHTAASSEQIDSIRVLIQAGCDLWARNNVGETPFDIALAEFGGDHPITTMLIEAQDADLNDIDGMMEAIERGDAPALLSIVKAKPYFHRNEMAATALHHAIYLNQLTCVEVLLDNHWNPLWEDEDGKTAFGIAKEQFEPDSPMLRLLESYHDRI